MKDRLLAGAHVEKRKADPTGRRGPLRVGFFAVSMGVDANDIPALPRTIGTDDSGALLLGRQ